MAMRTLGFVVLTAAMAAGQQGRIAGPVVGFVFDGSARAIRPILGIPGASVLGDPLAVGCDLSYAAVSPRLDSAVAAAADGSFHVFKLNAGAATEVAANGITAAPERAVFSPSGSAAAVYAGSRIQVITGLPASPTPGATFDISGLLAMPGSRGHHPLTGSFAVSDDGQYVLVAEGSGVQAFGPGASRQVLSAQGAFVAFAPGSHDAAVAGSGVTILKDVAGSAAPQSIAGEDATRAAIGAAFSADGGKLYVASKSAQSVTVFDLSAGTNNAVGCDCTPAGITPMGNVYRMNEVGTAPLWLLDPGTATPRIVFVPAKPSL